MVEAVNKAVETLKGGGGENRPSWGEVDTQSVHGVLVS